MAAPPESSRELLIRPETPISTQDLQDIWTYRELLWILALRDVSVRYKQAVLGVAWAVLQPVTQVIIFTVLFNRFAGIHTDSEVPYPLFCLSGLLVWTLFSSGLSHASDSLERNANLVTKVYFPRVIIPVSAVLSGTVDFAISFLLLLVLMFFFHVPLHLSALWALPLGALSALCAVAVGLWTSAINIQFRDVRHALPFFIQLLVYLTPVFYPVTMVPVRYRGLVWLNPMAAVVDSFRAVMFGQVVHLGHLAMSVAFVLVVGTSGFIYFRRMERSFADRI